MNFIRLNALTAALVAGAWLATPAVAVDWASVPGKDVTLLYPAQMNWELLLTQAEHSGAGKFREGKNCRACHDGEEASSGKLMVTDKALEPTPIAGKPGSIKANVKVAHDADKVYVRVEWDPGKQPDSGMEPKFDSKVALMIDDGKVTEVSRDGCFAGCHSDLQAMPNGGTGNQTMYLVASRAKMSRTGGGEVKSADELAKMRADGAYLEYWQASLNPGAPPVVVDGTILEKRQENAMPAVTATSEFAGGKWTVVFSRKLTAGAPYKDIVPGKVYTLGLAIHAGHTNHRFHYVSLERTLVLDKGPADFVAPKSP
jgi:cytochrome c-type protein NapC